VKTVHSQKFPTAPPITQDGGVVIVRGEALRVLYRATLALAARHHRDGLASPALLHALRAELYRASMSRSRRKLATAVDTPACCTCQDGDDWIGVAAASALLSVSRRQVQRLAEHDAGLLGARRIGSIWALRRSAVLALAERRKAVK
jgi:hypothetical protein